jgi:hypothetical protein
MSKATVSRHRDGQSPVAIHRRQTPGPSARGLPRPLRGLAMTAWGWAGGVSIMAGAAVAALPGAALAHPGHDGGLGHLHEWDLGFAVLAALAVGGIAYLGSRALAKNRKRRK